MADNDLKVHGFDPFRHSFWKKFKGLTASKVMRTKMEAMTTKWLKKLFTSFKKSVLLPFLPRQEI
jgi:hypothetical protein